MGQVTIYLDEDSELKARSAANAEGVSLSKWVAQRIQRGVRAEWPAFMQALAGAWADFPSAEAIRASQGQDVARERL
jgi:hypothetical protein